MTVKYDKHLLGRQAVITAVHLNIEVCYCGNSLGLYHRGMLACFFQGLTCFLLASTSRSLQILLRVVDGSMMSSTKPNKQTNKHLVCV